MGERLEWDIDMEFWKGLTDHCSIFGTVKQILGHAFGRFLDRHVCNAAASCHASSRRSYRDLWTTKSLAKKVEKWYFGEH